MPGTDHAGIATQTVVEKRLQRTGFAHKRRRGFGREEFVARVQAGRTNTNNGSSANSARWAAAATGTAPGSRWTTSAPAPCGRTFFNLFRDGLIYRGKRLVNWDPVTQTALSDDEVEMREIEGAYYFMRYPLVRETDADDHTPVTWGELARRGYPGAEDHPDDEQAWVTVATTRPETYLGDSGIAVNPKDPRARALEGFRAELPIVGRRIPIVEDEHVVLPVSLGGDAGDAKAEMSTGVPQGHAGTRPRTTG